MASSPTGPKQGTSSAKRVSVGKAQAPTGTQPVGQNGAEQPCPETSNCAETNALRRGTASREHKVFTVTKMEEYEALLQQAGNKLVLVEFYATWCGPCRMIGTKLEELATQYAMNAMIIKIDVDEFEEVAISYNVTSMPTFLFLKNNKKLSMFAGSNADRVVQAFQKFIGDPPTQPEEEPSAEDAPNNETAAASAP